MNLPSSTSYTVVGDRFGVSRVTVCYYLSLLNRLPVEFVAWLENSEDLRLLSFFTEKRLRPITRMDDLDEQSDRLNELLEESGVTAFRLSRIGGQQQPVA